MPQKPLQDQVQQHLQKLAQALGRGAWFWDVKNKTFTGDEVFYEITGRAGQAIQKLEDFKNVIHPDDYAAREKLVEQCLAGTRTKYQTAYRLQGDKERWLLESTAVTETDPAQNVLVLAGVMQDVTEQKQAALRYELQQKEKRNQQLEQEITAAVHELEKTKTVSNTMFDANPHVNLLLDRYGKVVDCNPAAVAFFNFDSKNELAAYFDDEKEHIIPPYQPDGRKSRRVQEIIAAALAAGQLSLEGAVQIHGQMVPVAASFKKITVDDQDLVVAYIVDLTQLKEAQQELVKQDTLLQVFHHITSALISAQPQEFDEVLQWGMGQIGEIVRADRMYIWQNFKDKNTVFGDQIYEWSKQVPPQQGNDSTSWVDYENTPYFKKELFAGRTVNALVKDLPKQEQAILSSQGIVSVLIVPIIINDDMWGFIGFDNCHEPRRFTQNEEKVLQSGANTLISSILRNDMTTRLIEARNSLLHRDILLRAVNTAATLLMGEGSGSFFDRLYGALRAMGKSLDVDRAYIWRNSVVDGRLCCSQVCEWSDGNPSPHEVAPVNIPYDAFVPDLPAFLRPGRLNKEYLDLDEAVANFPGMEGVVSILLLPIFIGGDFWGFIGFDDCEKKRTFSKTQEDLMESGGMLLAAAILREDMTEKLVQAKEEALDSARAKSDFLSRMSHEIRTPMNAIIGMTAIAGKTDDLAKVRQCLEKVDSSSRQLLGLINDVLDMSKIEANKLEVANHPFDFEKMMQNVFNVISLKLEEKKQRFTFDFDKVFTRQILSDELRLSQVFINLLTNAVKFTPEEGSIKLIVRETPTDQDHSRLYAEVIDNGIGIAKERIPQLFQSFEQGDGSVTRRYGGTGLGLAISQRIIELMGGKIYLESEKGAGSRFYFEIPVGWAEPITARQRQKALKKGMRVLVVDDSAEVLEYFENILHSFGAGCDTAADGYEAVRLVQRQARQNTPYDAVFIDWNMPGLNGGETAEKIREAAGEKSIVILISVSDLADIQEDLTGYGITHFLAKPALPSHIFNALIQLTSQQVVCPPADPVSAAKSWKGKTLLLAEDIEINREIVMSILEETGVTIDTAADGRQAVDMFENDPDRYDLILMDIQMPVLDGLSAAKEIRQLPFSAAGRVPIIAMTANAFKEDERLSFEAGMNGHIAKPIEVDLLLTLLGQYLDDIQR